MLVSGIFEDLAEEALRQDGTIEKVHRRRHLRIAQWTSRAPIPTAR
jgi:hypothetical protein